MLMPVGSEERLPRLRFPVVTATIVGLNVAVFLIEVLVRLTRGQRGLDDFMTDFGVVPDAVVHGRSFLIPFFLTLLTSMFLHAGPMHLAGNMFYLWAFGDNVEDRVGRWRYVVFYLLSGLVASAAHIAANPDSVVPSVGASGAIAGVLAGYLILFPTGQVRLFIFLGPFTRIRRLPALLFIGFWFVLQLFSGVGSLGAETAESGGTAYWAHIGGFVAGLAMAGLYRLILDRRAAHDGTPAGAGQAPRGAV